MRATLARLSKVIFALGCAALFGSALSQTANEMVADYESVRLSGKLGKARTRFTLHLKCIAPTGATKAANGEYIGTDGQDPACIVQTISLKLNNRPIVFPAKSYKDLSDVVLPRGVYLTTRGDVVVLHILGGDGAGSYKARFLVERQRLVAREIEQLNEKGEPQKSRQTY